MWFRKNVCRSEDPWLGNPLPNIWGLLSLTHLDISCYTCHPCTIRLLGLPSPCSLLTGLVTFNRNRRHPSGGIHFRGSVGVQPRGRVRLCTLRHVDAHAVGPRDTPAVRGWLYPAPRLLVRKVCNATRRIAHVPRPTLTLLGWG